MHSTTPAFNLKVVLKETGLAADTLRAWERRYGIPMPERTPGGHRLYSERDVALIKWLMARQAEGLTISRAVDLWKEQTASGADPLADSPSLSFTLAQTSPESNLTALRDQWLGACLHFDESRAEQTLNQAFSMYPVEAVCTEVLQRGLSEIGNEWYENRASVQQEHFASALAMRRLDALLAASPAPSRKQTILVGCPTNEWHTFTPLLIALFLRRRSWNVVYLGANVPAHRFEETVAAVGADLVILVAQQLATAATLYQTAQMLAAHKVRLTFGGRIFNLHPTLARRIPGHFLGERVDESIVRMESLLASPARGVEAEAVAEKYVNAAAAFESHRPRIEAALSASVGSLGFGAPSMNTAIQFLGDNIAAALHLGDMTLVDSEIDWVRNLMKSNHIPEDALGRFLRVYAEAVNANINGAGKPIFDWIEQFKG